MIAILIVFDLSKIHSLQVVYHILFFGFKSWVSLHFPSGKYNKKHLYQINKNVICNYACQRKICLRKGLQNLNKYFSMSYHQQKLSFCFTTKHKNYLSTLLNYSLVFTSNLFGTPIGMKQMTTYLSKVNSLALFIDANKHSSQCKINNLRV